MSVVEFGNFLERARADVHCQFDVCFVHRSEKAAKLASPMLLCSFSFVVPLGDVSFFASLMIRMSFHYYYLLLAELFKP
ncbi:hypothetical protein BCR43DRAFT_481980 [Syncephalastrum racemosum]|uniref:Uncharacterized protein n=1 Tax=Syncephalastrum racemosum TaxID=13706 RepID=A0A1X2HSX8_SYNRA|nr:hypothetical protein BCR43DRAFT_481980 [Syncephalastrum racemosum]